MITMLTLFLFSYLFSLSQISVWSFLGSCLVYLLVNMATGVVFQKAGRAWWEGFLPIYSSYVLAKIAGQPGWWFILFYIPVIGMIFEFMTEVTVARRFGVSWLFAIGMTLMPVVFYPILAWGPFYYDMPIRHFERKLR